MLTGPEAASQPLKLLAVSTEIQGILLWLHVVETGVLLAQLLPSGDLMWLTACCVEILLSSLQGLTAPRSSLPRVPSRVTNHCPVSRGLASTELRLCPPSPSLRSCWDPSSPRQLWQRHLCSSCSEERQPLMCQASVSALFIFCFSLMAHSAIWQICDGVL